MHTRAYFGLLKSFLTRLVRQTRLAIEKPPGRRKAAFSFGRHRKPPIVIANYSKSSVFCQVIFSASVQKKSPLHEGYARAAAISTERWFSDQQDTTSPESAQNRVSQIPITVTLPILKSDTRIPETLLHMLPRFSPPIRQPNSRCSQISEFISVG